MKISCILVLCLTVLATCTAGAAEKELTINGNRLSMQAPVKCPQAHRSGKELAKYLIQYDPAQDPKLDIRDETPWTKKEIQLIKKALAEEGFHYPNGQDSVITWMDFDGDGVCDFTASAGVGGMRSTDRMFLFRGLQKGDFRLAAAYHAYMDGSSLLLPYIPVTVAGEKLPVLVTKDTLMQWQHQRKQFATCETSTHGPQAKKQQGTRPVLAALCPHAQEIYTWAAGQLPHENEIPY